MEVYINLLKDAFLKQKILFESNEWSQQLLSFAPPVLWFGDINVPKPKIITIGANPSRSEFLKGSKKIINATEYSDLKYLNDSEKRFFHLSKPIYDCNINEIPFSEIIEGYNKYFWKGSKPYARWFGRKGKVEGLINGLDASFYSNDIYAFQALHLDLFPFATLKDFTSIQSSVDNDLFSDNWSKKMLENLIKNIEPKLIVVFGLTNRNYFEKIFSDSLNFSKDNMYETKNNLRTNYKIGTFKNIKYVGLSTNFGDPKCFRTEDVNSVGQFVKNEIKLD